MQVLIDFDNLPSNISRQGPRYLADLIDTRLQHLLHDPASRYERLEMRLYGGWNSAASPSQRAALVGSAVMNELPHVKLRGDGQVVRFSGILAESMIINPQHVLPHTFRPRSDAPQMHANRSALICQTANCVAAQVEILVRTRACPIPQCNRGISDFMSKAEQKLVDTMMVCDLIEFALLGESHVVLVSSDDDLWPGMLTAMHRGANVIHITTKHPSSARLYLPSNITKYTTATL